MPFSDWLTLAGVLLAIPGAIVALKHLREGPSHPQTQSYKKSSVKPDVNIAFRDEKSKPVNVEKQRPKWQEIFIEFVEISTMVVSFGLVVFFIAYMFS